MMIRRRQTNNDELIDKLMKPVLAAKTMNDIYNRAREAVKNSLTVLDAMSEQLRKSNSKLAELEASNELHRNLNREVAIALGLKSGDSWHDLPERVIDLRKRIAELEQAQRWIPVSERLPERQGTTYLNARYLVLYRGYYRDINVFSPSNKKWLCGEVDKTEYVTHWMDIPDLPEEVQK